MRAFVPLLIIPMLIANSCVLAGGPESAGACQESMAEKALDEVPGIRSWNVLYKAYKDFERCDDGAVAEGFTESVIRLLADKWESIEQLESLAKTDRKFLEFAYRHINESASEADLNKIISNVNSIRCSAADSSICEEVGRAAARALSAM